MTTHLFKTREAWLGARRKGIGASDSPALFGLTPSWRNELELYLDKRGLLPDNEDEAERLYWGRAHEPAIRRRFRELTGRIVRPPSSKFELIQSDRIPYMLATPDGWQNHGVGKGLGVLECKTCGPYVYEHGERIGSEKVWRERVPLLYQVQVQHQLFVTGCAWGSVACLVAGQKLFWHDVERDDVFIQTLLAKCADFWQRVESENPPAATGPRALQAVKALHPDDNGDTVELDAIARHQWERIRELKDDRKAINDELDEREMEVRFAIGDASYATLPDGTKLSLLTTERAGYTRTVKPCKFRVLREVKNDGK